MVQGRISITIPFDKILHWTGKNCSDRTNQSCCCCDLACQPHYRQEIIALSGKDCCWHGTGMKVQILVDHAGKMQDGSKVVSTLFTMKIKITVYLHSNAKVVS